MVVRRSGAVVFPSMTMMLSVICEASLDKRRIVRMLLIPTRELA